ncbi:DUF3313 domain-containing protein [Trinickia terrae]|uniref:DUF3313 domain-containing protein n=1 Tax=Trinickia terrae TaxID=2571161 RepID=A0A4U1HJE5_9BURK|nr:DUF3313 domain-containing protein [Trinickia terrae]TKC81309.1 DUF3313 domain-containing protein [Trinickia terrae]
MLKTDNARQFLIAAACVALVGCSSVQPVPYSGIESASLLKPNSQDDARRVPYRYEAPAAWQTYRKLIVDPVVIYRGTDNQFGDMREADKAELAGYMQSRFSEKLGRRFEITGTPGPATLRLKLTLAGAETTTPVIGTLSHFDIAGGVYNTVQAVRGGKGSFTGSVTYAVEIYDTATNRLLTAYVTKQYPNAMNIGASFGSLGAAKTGVDKGADALIAQLK